MNKPEVYVKTNTLPQIDAENTLNNNVAFLQDINNHTVIDVGCGPGNVTFEKILPLLPTITKTVLGVDISYHNIEYARKHYQNDSRISYEVLDILADVLPKEYVCGFDLVLSFHCFHYVGNHHKALMNVYEMLKPNGKMLISFMGKCGVNDIYLEISNTPKWQKYMANDLKKWVPPYLPINYYEILLKEIGFEQIHCEEVKTHKYYSEQDTFDILRALNVYPVPKSQELEFIQDHMNCFEEKGLFTVQNDGKKLLRYEYDIFTFTAKKGFI
ncbi:hypothetical protein FQR65_LT00052 [Abscondita terminalis]|nr:hypothetical protein FQR65_LT00052 [Abscondita terminalis]